jgi:DNA-binding transcriptional ArsR family regulator
MDSPWKALSDDNRREILLLLGKRDMIPTEIAEHFNFTLPATSTRYAKVVHFLKRMAQLVFLPIKISVIASSSFENPVTFIPFIRSQEKLKPT